jgi:hypothetical protein
VIQFIHPLELAEKAVNKARKLMKQTYSLGATREISNHARDDLIPALRESLDWAHKTIVEEQSTRVKLAFSLAIDAMFEVNGRLEYILESEYPEVTNLKRLKAEFTDLLKEVKKSEKLLAKYGS